MSKTFIAIVLVIFVITGALFLFVLRWGSELKPLAIEPPAGPTVTPGPPAPPPPPSVTFTIQLEKKGNSLWVQWQNLPAGTDGLNIYRSQKGKDMWSLWKTIDVTGRTNGTEQFSIGSATFANYSFYAEATGGGNNSATSTGSGGTPVLWTSSSTVPTVTTSTPALPPSPPATGEIPTSTASSTLATTTTVPAAPTSTAISPTSTASQGTPYYTPQLTISGYGTTQTGTFWVQHVNNMIQVGWQNLPAQTTRIEISRTLDVNATSSWSLVLAQENPTVAQYSIQLVDDTLGKAYYYRMVALSGSSTVGTYGPNYLPPIGQ